MAKKQPAEAAAQNQAKPDKTPERTRRNHPANRALRVFAFDPGVGATLQTRPIRELTLNVRWEKSLAPGPIGEYLEVIDHDPASQCFYAPVDLNDPHLLAQDGVALSEGDPQFHQQMVYAVAMRTIETFEQALGRVALWSPRKTNEETTPRFVRRLRIYPHALREANAYYSPEKKALLFGYFPTRGSGPGQTLGGTVFTCLSQDIVAHETTHALLDGLHPHFADNTNHDVWALHEAFADLVAIFQRFAHPEVVEHQIALTRGRLEDQNLLGALAQQFGTALGSRGALRDYLGSTDSQGHWTPMKPDRKLIDTTHEPHARGAILVAAIFQAFVEIYKSRSADLFRIGQAEPGRDLHPDLVRRLAREAAATAESVLRMCIRALDYCPPVDVDFGIYLRAMITADFEHFPDDSFGYRVAVIEAFRQWGIFPQGVRNLSEETLRWRSPDQHRTSAIDDDLKTFKACLKHLFNPVEMQRIYQEVRSEFGSPPVRQSQEDDPAEGQEIDINFHWGLNSDRRQVDETVRANCRWIHSWLHQTELRNLVKHFRLTLDPDAPATIPRSTWTKLPAIQVHSCRVARRRGPRGEVRTDLVIELLQRRAGFYDVEKQKRCDAGTEKFQFSQADFMLRRGCTLIIDPVDQELRYVIHTHGSVAHDVSADTPLNQLRRYLTKAHRESNTAFYAPPSDDREPFAVVHRHGPDSDDFSFADTTLDD